jgi:hypothetical protein
MRMEAMRVVAQIEYEVNDNITMKAALDILRNDAPHGSITSTNMLRTVKYKRVVSVRRKVSK